MPGDGPPVQHFTVVAPDKTLLQQPNVLTVKLSAPESYGIDAGQPLMLYGMKIGQVISRDLDENGVNFVVAINPDHRQLVHSDSKFIVNSRLDVKFGLDGMQVLGASAREWVDGGIRLDPGKRGAPKAAYPLFADAERCGGRYCG